MKLFLSETPPAHYLAQERTQAHAKRLYDVGVSTCVGTGRRVAMSITKEIALRKYVGMCPAPLPYLLLLTAVIGAATLFLYPFQYEFPMDDTYIHFTYAQNLSTHGQIFLNTPDETGLGVTSPLWITLLGGTASLGIPMHLAARIMGLTALVLVCFLVYAVASGRWSMPIALAAAMLVAFSGNMIWFALSGMETMLFLALGMSAIWLYRQRRMVLSGVALGLMTLTRPEGLVLLVAIVILDVTRQRTVRDELWRLIMSCFLICLPWFLYLYLRTGQLLPTSVMGKQLTFQTAIREIAKRNPELTRLAQFKPFIYLGSWAIYLALFALGGMSLPAPRLPIGAIVDNPDYSFSLWAVIGLIFIILPLLFAAVWRIWRARPWRGWLQDRRQRAILALLFWALLHNISYMFFMPVPGTASRYGAVNYIILPLILVVGFFWTMHHSRLWKWFLPGLIIISLTNTLYWNRVYDANVEHMRAVRMAAAKFIRQELPAGERCGAYDIGAIRFYSDQPVIDLGGLIDPEATRHFLSGEYDDFLLDNGVTCLLLPGSMQAKDEGWFDMAHIMGLDSSELIDLRLLARFEIDRERWMLGYLPTNNYQASVTIYEVSEKPR